tara:strand:+ start:116464 stop:117129 length:666 start_codon:yes stop_codon:yes gene_type:complete
MSLLKKLFTLGRKAKHDLEDALDQETIIAQTEQALRDDRAALAKTDGTRIEFGAKRREAERKVAEFTESAAKFKARAIQARDSGNEELAMKALGEMQKAQTQLEAQQKIFDSVSESIATLDRDYDNLTAQIEARGIELEELKAQDAILDVRESLASASHAVHNNTSNAASSLSRAKEIQQKRQDKLDASKELDSARDLDAQFAELDRTGGKSQKDLLAELS